MRHREKMFLDDINNSDSHWVDEFTRKIEKMAKTIISSGSEANARAAVILAVDLKRTGPNEVSISATITARRPKHVNGSTKIYVSNDVCFYTRGCQLDLPDEQLSKDFDDMETNNIRACGSGGR